MIMSSSTTDLSGTGEHQASIIPSGSDGEYEVSLTTSMLVENTKLAVVGNSPAVIIGYGLQHLQASTLLIKALHRKTAPMGAAG